MLHVHDLSVPAAERILGLCTSVFRIDTVLLVLREGDREFRKGCDDAFTPSTLSLAARALEPPDADIAVVDEPAADSRCLSL